MKGFGEKKKSSQKQPANKFARIPADKLKAIAFQYHMSGNLDEASKAYQAFLNNGLSDPDVFSNYALLCQTRGELKKALNIYQKSVTVFPGHAFSHANLGYLYLELGSLDEAEVSTRKAIELQPELANAHSYLGLILRAKGEIDAAETAFRHAIHLQPELADSYINLGQLLKNKGSLDDAEQVTRKAIELQNDSAIAHLNLGGILQEKSNLTEAEALTRKAISLQSDLRDVHLNLAVILKEQGKTEQSILSVIKEIELYPQNHPAVLLLNSLLKDSDLNQFKIAQLRSWTRLLMGRNDVAHKNIFAAIDRLMPEEYLDDIAKRDKDLFSSKSFKYLQSHNEIVRALALMPFTSLHWEKALTNIRKQLCILNQNEPFNNKFTELTIALAMQCFLNEFIYSCDQQEAEIIEQLKNTYSSQSLPQSTLAVLACYIPIYNLVDYIPAIREYKPSNQYFKELIEIQLHEPDRENELKASINMLGTIKDHISTQVKQQYEEHPYPRWRYASYAGEVKQSIISAINNEIHPNRITPTTYNRKNNILIAGCGTGQQIFDAISYDDSNITAIDLSLSSIAYAQRKTAEMGIDNIRYIQMDILNLLDLDQKFDLIECTGVLHHMDVPSMGIEAILSVLSDDGVLKLGLYSEFARKDIIEARSIISAESLRGCDSDIRKFRQNLINGQYPGIKSLTQWSDFYTTSMCRDLCFHVKEHRYTLPLLSKLLDDLNLRFLGFSLPVNIKNDYATKYPTDSLQLDLSNWHQYEEANPSTFREMYQFWLARA